MTGVLGEEPESTPRWGRGISMGPSLAITTHNLAAQSSLTIWGVFVFWLNLQHKALWEGLRSEAVSMVVCDSKELCKLPLQNTLEGGQPTNSP